MSAPKKQIDDQPNLVANPQRGPVDIAALHERTKRRYPKTLARLAQ